MKRLLSLLLCSLLCLSAAFSQKTINGTLRGKVMDTVGKQPLTDATISIMSLKDSSSVAFTTADAKGNFEVKGPVSA